MLSLDYEDDDITLLAGFLIIIINDRFACSPLTNEMQFQDKVNVNEEVAIEVALTAVSDLNQKV